MEFEFAKKDGKWIPDFLGFPMIRAYCGHCGGSKRISVYHNDTVACTLCDDDGKVIRRMDQLERDIFIGKFVLPKIDLEI